MLWRPTLPKQQLKENSREVAGVILRWFACTSMEWYIPICATRYYCHWRFLIDRSIVCRGREQPGFTVLRFSQLESECFGAWARLLPNRTDILTSTQRGVNHGWPVALVIYRIPHNSVRPTRVLSVFNPTNVVYSQIYDHWHWVRDVFPLRNIYGPHGSMGLFVRARNKRPFTWGYG